MNAKEARKRIVQIAKAYKGAVRGDSRHKKIIDTFNKIKPDGWAMNYTAPWCATSVSSWAVMAFGRSIASEFFPLSANCNTIIAKAKKKGIWKEDDGYKPSKGDWVLYDWQDSGYGDNRGSADHVGLVTSVVLGYINVLEGNKHDKVASRRIPINGRYIRGFVIPKYAKVAEAMTKKEKPKKKKASAKKAKKDTKKAIKKAPKKTAKKKVPDVYIVKKNDTLSGIAERYGTTWQKLKKINGLVNANMIYTGQKLKLK